MEDSKAPVLDIKDYAKVYFRLNSAYQWGKGWSLTQEQNAEYKQECIELSKQMGFDIYNDGEGSSIFTCVEAVNKDGEYLYFHPMDITGVILKSNIDSYTKAVEGFSSKYTSLSNVDLFGLKEDNRHDNPNTILQERFGVTRQTRFNKKV